MNELDNKNMTPENPEPDPPAGPEHPAGPVPPEGPASQEPPERSATPEMADVEPISVETATGGESPGQTASEKPQDAVQELSDAELPLVAVVMPVRNESRYIADTLTQIAEQDYPIEKIQVVVADDHSTDGTPEIAAEFHKRLPGLKIVIHESNGPAGGRNVGIRETSAPYIIVIDGHVHIPSKTLLRDMVNLFVRTRAYCLCRPQQLDPPGISLFQLAVAKARGSFLGHNPASDIYTDIEKETDPTSSGAMWRREVFEKLGMFDESLNACEDVDLNYRVKQAGMRAWVSPRLRIKYFPRDSVTGLWRQMIRYGAGRYLFARKHNQFTLTQLLAPLAVASLVLFALLSLLGSSSAQHFFELGVNIYLITILGTTVLLAFQDKQFAYLFSLPVIYPIIHFGLGVGFLNEWIRIWRRDRAQTPPTTQAPTQAPTAPPTAEKPE